MEFIQFLERAFGVVGQMYAAYVGGKAALEAGVPVPVPPIQVGTDQGKKLIFTGTLTLA